MFEGDPAGERETEVAALRARLARLADLGVAADLRAELDALVRAEVDAEVLLDAALDVLLHEPALGLRDDCGAFLTTPGDRLTVRIGTIRGGVAGAVVGERAAAVTAFLNGEPAPPDDEPGHHIVALLGRAGPVGALSLVPAEIDGWSVRWREVLRAVCDPIGLAIEAASERVAQEETHREAIAARNAAMEASRSKSEFLANMSHELRTPLNAILGYSELIRDQLADDGHHELAADVDRVYAAGSHLLRLINGILDLSKVESGRMALEVEEIKVDRLCREVAATIHPLLAANGNRFELDCPDEIGAVCTDATKLRQVLINLLGNATKFTDKGAIRLRARRVGGNLSLSVTDTGIGMTPDQLARVFEPFVQADASITRRFGGTGLGLSVSRRFVELMGGRLTATSRPGEGSTFTVLVPADQRDRAGRGGPR